MLWLILPNSKVPSTGYLPRELYGFISQNIKHIGTEKGHTHGPEKEPYYRPHSELKGSGSWCAGLPLHLETKDQAGLGLWSCHRGPHPGQNPSGHCDDFRAEDKEACRGQLVVGLKGTWRHLQLAIEKESGSDRMPSPCQCMLSEPGALLGGRVHLLFLFFHLLNPDTVVSTADPWACAPVEQRAKWERKILNQRPQTRNH